MYYTPITLLSTQSMNRLWLFNLWGTKIYALDTAPLRSLVEIDIRYTPITELDLRSSSMLMKVEGCRGRGVLTVPGVKRYDWVMRSVLLFIFRADSGPACCSSVVWSCQTVWVIVQLKFYFFDLAICLYVNTRELLWSRNRCGVP